MGSGHHVEAGEPWHREQENGNLGRVASAGKAEWRLLGKGLCAGQLGEPYELWEGGGSTG